MAAEEFRLNFGERKRLDEFLRSTDATQLPPRYSYLFASILAMIGLFLFVATSMMAVTSINNVAINGANRVEFWMFLSGLIGSAVIIATAFIYLLYAGKIEDRKRLGATVQKLLDMTR